MIIIAKKGLAKFRYFNGKRYTKTDTVYNKKSTVKQAKQKYREMGYSVRVIPHKVNRKQKYSLYARSRI